MSTIYNLHFKWTFSRGRDTSGYNICTLLVNGNKAGKCMGGGYDMQGTSFAEWLQAAFQCELHNLLVAKGIRTRNAHNSYEEKGGVTSVYSLPEFYGMNYYVKANGDSHVVLDGACGFDSMRRIAEAIGIKLQWNKESGRYKNHTFYTAIIN